MANDYGTEPRLPAIPDLRTSKVEEAVRVMKEWIEVRQGARGDGLDRAVTMRDLLNSGLAEPGTIAPLFPDGIGPLPVIQPVQSPAIPPTPTDLSAAGAITTIILTWEFARGYTRLAYFEVWRSLTDAIGDAELLAQSYSTTYADAVGTGASYYYWVRAVSDAGVSPFNAVSGTHGQTALNVTEVFDAITDEINDSGLLEQLTVKVDDNGYVSGYGLASTPSNYGASTTFAILANRFVVAGPASGGTLTDIPFFVQATATTVNGVAVPPGVYMTDAFIHNGVITNAKIGNLAVDDAKVANMNVSKLRAGKVGVSEYIESSSYVSGVTGFRIHGNGNAEFNNVTARGTVYATAGQIGGNTIDSTGVQSPGYNGTSGWRINSDGTAVFGNNVTIKGVLSGATGTFAGSLSAATGTFAGSLSAAGGTFAGSLSAATGTFSGSLTAAAVNAVDTLNVAGNAITGNVSADGAGGTLPAGWSASVVSAAITMPAGNSGVVVFANITMDASSGASITTHVYRNGAPIKTIGVSLLAGYATTFTIVALDSAPAVGSNTYEFVIANPTSGPGSMVASNYYSPSIVVAGTKR